MSDYRVCDRREYCYRCSSGFDFSLHFKHTSQYFMATCLYQRFRSGFGTYRLILMIGSEVKSFRKKAWIFLPPQIGDWFCAELMTIALCRYLITMMGRRGPDVRWSGTKHQIHPLYINWRPVERKKVNLNFWIKQYPLNYFLSNSSYQNYDIIFHPPRLPISRLIYIFLTFGVIFTRNPV